MRKHVAFLFVLMLSLSALAGCGGTSSETKTDSTSTKAPVEVQIAFLRGPSAVSGIHMISNYDGSQDGMKVAYSIEQGPDILSQRLVEGQITMATLPTNMAANLYNKNGKYVMCAMNTWGVMYVLTAGEEVSSWPDLKGREIDTSGKGSAADIVFQYLLKENGIDPATEVNQRYASTPAEQAQLIAAGQSKISVLPEPWASTVLTKNPGAKVALDFQEEWTRINGEDVPFAQTCLVVNAEFATANPDLVEKLLAAYASSLDWVNKNPEDAGKLVAARSDIGLDALVTAEAIPRCNIRYQSAADARTAVNKCLEVLFAFNPASIGGKMPDEGFYYQK